MWLSEVRSTARAEDGLLEWVVGFFVLFCFFLKTLDSETQEPTFDELII
jgi:hypothetical protein